MRDFSAARRAALIRDLLGTVRGQPTTLLSFERVREKLHLRHLAARGLMDVPLDQIVGSIGRSREFDRAFLPRREELRERWQQVRDLAEGPRGFPPVELYKVGAIYFVIDGHHRVSVARSLGAPAIEAWVKEFDTPVPVSSGLSAADLLLKAALADFLEAAGLDIERPGDYEATVADGYERLLDHVSVHRYFLGLDRQRPVSWPEAVESWRDHLYRPMVERIRQSGVLADFPGRTEADLYLFVMEHLHHLREQYGEVRPLRALRHFALSQRLRRGAWSMLRSRLRGLWARRRRPDPKGAGAGPPPG